MDIFVAYSLARPYPIRSFVAAFVNPPISEGLFWLRGDVDESNSHSQIVTSSGTEVESRCERCGSGSVIAKFHYLLERLGCWDVKIIVEIKCFPYSPAGFTKKEKNERVLNGSFWLFDIGRARLAG